MEDNKSNSYFIDDVVSETAAKTFGIKYLYPWQRIVIANILDAAKQEDEGAFSKQIVLLPTGAGKSFCFLVPSLLLPGPSLVIYPLLSLMSDQKRKMDESGLGCVIFRGGQSEEEIEESFRRILNGSARVIIANPEVLQKKSLLKRISSLGISHIAIDEAHCVSEWGDTFRPSYLALGDIIKTIKADVVTAFTATASESVLNRIAEVLFDGEAHIVRGECDRPNIHFSVINCYNKKKMALKLVFTEQKPLIIFCGTRYKAEDMSREIALCLGKDKVRFYHAGMDKAEKTKVEQWFFNKEDAVLCATCAYGMGVDKKNVRTVVHLEPSPTLESYMQEAGRAGRDGKDSKAFLLWSPIDHTNYLNNNSDERKKKVAYFAETKTCRRDVLIVELGGESVVCSGCDVCDRGGEAPFAEDGLFALKTIKKNRKVYNYDGLSSLLINKFNRKDFSVFNMNVWEHSDIDTILSILFEEKKIRKCKFPWTGRITV